MEARKNALAPIEFIVTVAGSLLLLSLVLIISATVFGSGSIMGLGDSEVCLSTDSNAVTIAAESSNGAHVVGLKPGGRSYPEQVSICQRHPDARQRGLYLLTEAPDLLDCLGFLFLTWRLIRYARRAGFFVADCALQLGRLGLYVLFGALAVAVIQAAAGATLLPTLAHTDGDAFDLWIRFFHLSWALLFAGFGLLTVNRVLAQTVPMQAELDATV